MKKIRALIKGWGYPKATMKVSPIFFQKSRREKKKEIPICLIPHLHVLVVFTQQLEISFDKIISSAV